MASEGPNYPSANAEVDLGGFPWANKTNIYASDNSYSQVSMFPNGTSNYLRGTGFGFAIPSGATIDGVQIFAEGKTDVGTTVYRLWLFSAGATIGASKDSGSVGTTEGTQTLGSSSDTWSATLSDTVINSSGFGFQLQSRSTYGGSSTHYIDSVSITVHYTTGGGSQGAALHHYRQQGMMRHQQPQLILPNRELITELPQRRLIENRLAT